jgi:hypothetical protein
MQRPLSRIISSPLGGTAGKLTLDILPNHFSSSYAGTILEYPSARSNSSPLRRSTSIMRHQSRITDRLDLQANCLKRSDS